MAIPWSLALKTIPWSIILAKAPAIAQAAETLLLGARARRDATPAASEMQSLNDRIAALERHNQADAEVLKQLAEQVNEISRAIEVLAVRQRWLLTLAIAATVLAGAAVLFTAVEHDHPAADPDAVEVVRHLSVASFLDASKARLMRDEAENNLLTGIAYGLMESLSSLQAPPYLATVTEHGVLQACGIRLAPFKFVVTRGSAPAMEALARDLFAVDCGVDGVTGPEPSSDDFAVAWAAMSGVPPRLGTRLSVHQARHVNEDIACLPPGALRPAVNGDVALLAGWIEALSRKANPDERPDAMRVATDGVRRGRFTCGKTNPPRRWPVGRARHPAGCAST